MFDKLPSHFLHLDIQMHRSCVHGRCSLEILCVQMHRECADVWRADDLHKAFQMDIQMGFENPCSHPEIQSVKKQIGRSQLQNAENPDPSFFVVSNLVGEAGQVCNQNLKMTSVEI